MLSLQANIFLWAIGTYVLFAYFRFDEPRTLRRFIACGLTALAVMCLAYAIVYTTRVGSGEGRQHNASTGI